MSETLRGMRSRLPILVAFLVGLTGVGLAFATASPQAAPVSVLAATVAGADLETTESSSCAPEDQPCHRACDEACRQVAFEDALSGLRDPELAAPEGGQVFRLQGDGMVLYGVFSAGAGRHEALLRHLSQTVER